MDPLNLVPDAEPVATPAVTPGANGPEHATHGGLVTCEACGSRITRVKGELFEVGPRIKTARKSEDKIEALEARIAELERDLAGARAEVKALAPAPPSPAAVAKRAGWGVS